MRPPTTTKIAAQIASINIETLYTESAGVACGLNMFAIGCTGCANANAAVAKMEPAMREKEFISRVSTRLQRKSLLAVLLLGRERWVVTYRVEPCTKNHANKPVATALFRTNDLLAYPCCAKWRL